MIQSHTYVVHNRQTYNIHPAEIAKANKSSTNNATMENNPDVLWDINVGYNTHPCGIPSCLTFTSSTKFKKGMQSMVSINDAAQTVLSNYHVADF